MTTRRFFTFWLTFLFCAGLELAAASAYRTGMHAVMAGLISAVGLWIMYELGHLEARNGR